MIKIVLTTLCLYAASLLAACASTPLVKQPPEWGYEKDAILLHLVSAPQLNLYQKQPHSLVICLYHLRDLNGFHQLMNEKDGLAKLLDCNRFDPSVANSKRLVVQPNRELTESLDRPDGAKFLGLVAGFYSLRREDAARTYAIPVTEVTIGSTLVQKTEKLHLDLYLDRQLLESKQTLTAAPAITGKERQ